MRGTKPHCNALLRDSAGLFCAVHAAEGRSGDCLCPFMAKDCHVVQFDVGMERRKKIQCGGAKIGVPTFVGVCQDFDPALWLQEKLGVISRKSHS